MRRVLSIMLGMLLLCTQLLAQNRTITGKVTDEKRNPVPNASVIIKGTTTGTTTAADGTFSISVPSNSRTLVISSIGMGEKEVTIGSQLTYDITLSASERNDLQEIVVVGYGVQKRADLTGSVATVKAAEIENKPFSSVDKILQGTVAGLQSVAGSGAPGALQSIRIRGTSSINAGNQPLWVIDGVPVNIGDVSRLTTSANTLSTLNPNDIESISVLKDAASESIYGSRAANGVILVTTKRGRAGKTKFKFDFESGQNDVAYTNPKYKSLTAAEYINITREGLVNLGVNQATIDATLTALGNGNGTDFNWLNAVTQKGAQQLYNLSASGGNDRTTFYISGGYFNQIGTTLATDLNRYSGAVRVTNKVSDKLSMNINLDGGFVRQHTPLNGGAFGNPVLSSYFILPTRSAYKPDGSFNILTSDFPTSSTFNTVALANMDKRYLKEFSIRGSISADYQILRNLKFRSQFGADFDDLEEDQYNNPFYGDGYTTSTSTTGRAFDYYTRYFNWIWTNTLDFHQNISSSGDVYFNIQGGYESQLSRSFFISSEGTGFPPTLLIQASAATATPKIASSTSSDYSFLSQFSTANVNYKDRYILSGSFRRDGSSRFGRNSLYGNFWSVGGSWNVTREAFMQDFSFFNQLKLRASYGLNGNGNINNYDWFAGYGYGFNYNNAPGSAPTNVGNPNLTWELNKPLNVGIDVSVLRNRLNFSADWYKRKTTDLLLAVPLSPTSGFNSQLKNIGEMENQGVELTINGTPVLSKSFSWNINFNFAHNKNRVTSLPNGADVAKGSINIREAYDVNTFYVRQYFGVNPANGDPLWYSDATKTGTTNNYSAAQRVMYGSASPQYFGGLTNTFTYKGFTLDFLLYYSFGNYVQDAWGGYYMGAGFGATFNKVARVLNRWQKPGDMTDVPKYIYGGNKSFQSFSTFYLNQGDFIRLRNLQVGYDIPKSILSRIKISNAMFYVRGSNLFTWVKDKNLPFDPEQGIVSQTNLDVFIPKTMTVGLTLGF